MERTSAGLRDILFDEIDALRKPKGNPQRALAVSALARQIIGTVETEMRFQEQSRRLKDESLRDNLGTLRLGSPSAASADETATAA